MSHPNILFIMTDQQRYDAVGANGNDVIHTPNLDRLAGEGTNFHDYYSNAPVCVPARCTLFTGRYPHSHRIRENHNLLPCNQEMHFFRVLKQAGYALGYTGKNHLLEQPELENFDYVGRQSRKGGELGAEADRLTRWYRDYRAKQAEAGTPELWRGGVFHDFPDEATRTGITAADGLEFLRDRPADQPFCLCCSFSDPHVPHLAPRRFEELYPPESMKPYPFRDGELEEKARRFGIKWRAQKSDTADDAGRRHYMAVYYAMITFVDEQVGRLLAELEAQGVAEDTIVVFTSDHGEFCFEHNMYKKDLVLLESLLHVPLMIRFPGRVQERAVRDSMAESVDLMPTLLDLAGVDTPFGVQGESLAPLIQGERSDHKDAVFAEICPPWLYNRFATYEDFEAHFGSWEKTPINVPGDYNKSIRERDWRYTWYGTGEEELYDHRSDPDELFNVAGKPEYAEVKQRLKMRLLEWLALSEDPLDPLSVRQLQAQYDAWKDAAPLPGSMGGPYWLEERFTPNPRKP